jgi:hypothetical protein
LGVDRCPPGLGARPALRLSGDHHAPVSGGRLVRLRLVEPATVLDR